jgi:hypothetical protein
MPVSRVLLLLAFAGLVGVTEAGAQDQYHSDPTPNATTTGNTTVYSKDLNAYPNYGVPDGAADIVYTGETWSWNFVVAAGSYAAPVSSAFFRLFLILDDHYEMDESLYSFDVLHNGTKLFSGPANLPHGTPFASQFINWVQRDYLFDFSPGVNTITIANTSNTRAGGWPDWIAVDRMEMHVEVTPEPATLILLGSGLVGLVAAVRLRRKNARIDMKPLTRTSRASEEVTQI